MKKFILMLQFLTRIPININLKVNEDDFFQGIVFFPLVGLIIGMFDLSLYYIGFRIADSFLGAVFAVIMGIFITGGLHLDGLADTFDGVYSNRPKDKVLEIMKDSRLGTNGALAIFVILITKIALIRYINQPDIYPVLLLMPAMSRLNIVFACLTSNPARNTGMGSMFIGRVNIRQFLIALSITIILSIIYPIALLGIITLIIFTKLYTNHISNKIDGMSGDTLGSLCELSEVAFLFFIILASKLV